MDTNTTDRSETPSGPMRWLWRVVRRWMKWRYGVRGAIKPPINWNRANSRWYRWRYCAWKVENVIYAKTGLPSEWWQSVERDVAPAMRAHLNHTDSAERLR